MARRTPPDPDTYRRLEADLRAMEERCLEMATERGKHVLIEHNRADSGRGGKYPYLTVRGLGQLNPDAFIDDGLEAKSDFEDAA